MTAKIKIALIGCGAVAQSVHLPVLSGLHNVEIVAIAEADDARRQQTAQRIFAAPQSPRAFSSYQEMLGQTPCDAVFICLPSALHAEAAISALHHKRHIYLEKPLATTLDDGNRVLDAWKNAQTIGVIGFNYRFNRLFQILKRRIQSNEIGEIVALRSVFSTCARDIPQWRQTRATGGGVLFDLASHHLDLLAFLLNQNIVEVSATLCSHLSENDSANLQLKLASGIVAQTFVSLCSVEEDKIEVFGTRGKLVADRYLALDVETVAPQISHQARLKRSARRLMTLRHAPYVLQKMRAVNGEPSYEIALRNFINAVQNRKNGATETPVLPDFNAGFQSLAVVAAAEESAQSGRIIVPQKHDS